MGKQLGQDPLDHKQGGQVFYSVLSEYGYFRIHLAMSNKKDRAWWDEAQIPKRKPEAMNLYDTSPFRFIGLDLDTSLSRVVIASR